MSGRGGLLRGRRGGRPRRPEGPSLPDRPAGEPVLRRSSLGRCAQPQDSRAASGRRAAAVPRGRGLCRPGAWRLPCVSVSRPQTRESRELALGAPRAGPLGVSCRCPRVTPPPPAGVPHGLPLPVRPAAVLPRVLRPPQRQRAAGAAGHRRLERGRRLGASACLAARRCAALGLRRATWAAVRTTLSSAVT